MDHPNHPRRDALAVLAFPFTLTVGIALIPVVADYSDHQQAQRAAEQTGRWLVGHLVAAVGFGLGIQAAAVIAGRIVERTREPKWSLVVLPFAAGAALHAAGLGLDGLGPVAMGAAGGQASTFFDATADILPPVFVVGAVLLALGQIPLVIGARKAGLVSPRVGYVILAAAVTFAAVEAIPSGYGLYGLAVLAWGIYGPIAWGMKPGELGISAS